MELPNIKQHCVGDDRGLLTVQVNGVHSALTHVQLNYLACGSGALDADKQIDQIIAALAELLQGEMVVMLLFDNCGVGKNWEIATALGRMLVDLGMCSIVDCTYFMLYHGA